jgi:murein DD-endopeptidase MepM/ murein hydrolase activator NlpD
VIKRIRRTCATAVAAVAVLCVAVPAQASAQPRIKHAECIAACTDGQPRGGSLLLVSGSDLGDVYAAIFPGGRDGIRDLRGRAGQASTSTVRVRVPWEATSGRFVLGTRGGLVSQGRPIQIAPVPVVSRWRCVSQCAPGRKVRGGSLLTVKGVRLQSIRSAVLQGGRGRADDLRARVGSQRFGSFRLRVPAKAVTGNFVVREQRRRSPSRRLVIEGPATAPAPAPAPGSGVFPVRGPHSFGGAGARFGAGRPGHIHQGQDVTAACGTPLVAVAAGTVRAARFQSAAGNYVVIDGASPDQDYAYMHLQSPTPLKVGQPVAAGAPVGAVGDTGRAQGCHLHFELWSAPGWYVGGRPFDPLPQLQAWDAAS